MELMVVVALILLAWELSICAPKEDDTCAEDSPVLNSFIWYIGQHEWGNNGIAVKTPNHFLIFDYCFTPHSQLPADDKKGIFNGGSSIVPKEIANENTFVFVTHNHADHYDPALKKLSGKVKKIHYIIPRCMQEEFGELESYTTTLGAEDTKNIDDLKVHAILTSKEAEGCCYLVEIDKMVIAYINPCYSGAEQAEPKRFIDNLPKLIGKRRIDMVFIGMMPIDFPKENNPRLIVPVHMPEEEIQITEQFDKEPRAVTLKMGEKYVYSFKDESSVKGKELKAMVQEFQVTYSEGGYQVNNYVLFCSQTKKAVLIDISGGTDKIFKYLQDNKLLLEYIIITHAHDDHFAEIKAIQNKLTKPVPVYMYPTEMMVKVPGVNPDELKDVKNGELLTLGILEIKVIHTPGHSNNAICLYVEKSLFAGDSLDIHCGKEMVAKTIKYLEAAKVPDDTKAYRGHEPVANLGEIKQDLK